MTRMDFDALRLRYKAALDAYHAHAGKVVEDSKGGERPSEDELEAEEHALWELATIRRQLLDALNGWYRPAN